MIKVFDGVKDYRLEENLSTVDSVRELQRKLYLKAKSEPKFRFYALYDKVYRTDVLWKSWVAVARNEGSPGIDGKTIKDIEQQIDSFIKELRDELKSCTYKPTPIRRVYIPKPDGNKRPLGIPTVRDRIVQMALKIVIEPIFEADFEDNSYGYRPKRSAHQAIEEIKKYLNWGYNEVIDGDLKDCFGSIPHKELLDMIATRIVDRKILHLIKLFLKVGVMVEGSKEIDDKGIPQGGVISPLLANIYLDKLDKGWKPYNKFSRLIRYADDFVILTKYKSAEMLDRLKGQTDKLKLNLNREKTKVVNITKETFDFLGFTFKKMKSSRGKLIAYSWPSHKAENKIKEKIRKMTDYRRPVKVIDVIPQLNEVLRGWVNYFKIGNSSAKFYEVKWYVENRVRKFMRRHRHKIGYGYKEYSYDYLYKQLGLYHNYRLSWTKTL